jgi:Rrf2 family protein
MQINTLARYGMRAVVRLALITDEANQLVSVKRIAEIEQISPKYLETIFALLKKNSILTAVKGKGGGYKFSRPPKEINSLEILEALGGEIGPVDCVLNENVCNNNPSTCTVSPLWCDLHVLIRDFLSSKTVADIVDHHKQLGKNNQKNNIRDL